MKILICVKEEFLSDILAIGVEGILHADTIIAADEKQSLNILNKKESLEAFIFESETENTPAILEARKRKIPILRITSKEGSLSPSSLKGEYVLTKPIEVKNFLELVDLLLKENEPSTKKEDLFCQIRLDTLLLFHSTFEFDTYIRLSEYKYVKVISKGNIFDAEKYTHFSSKGLKHLYVPKDSFILYLSSIANTLHGLLGKESYSLNDAVDSSIKAYDAVREGIHSLGISQETQRIMKLTVDLALASIERNPKLKNLLSTLIKNAESFQAWHSIALCYITCKLSSLMEWDSQNTHYKLAIASLLHDISLKNPSWSLFHNLEEAKNAGLNKDDLSEYTRHPLVAGDLARQIRDFPGDVDYIIAQHHERPDGSGFPYGQNHAKISPLSSLFIVGHDICHLLWEQKESFDLKSFLSSYDEKYPFGYFRKIRTALEKIVLEN